MFLIMLGNGKHYSDFHAIPVVTAKTQEQLDVAKGKVQAYLDLLKKEFTDDLGDIDYEKLKYDIANLPTPPYPTMDKEFFEFTKPIDIEIMVKDVEEET